MADVSHAAQAAVHGSDRAGSDRVVIGSFGLGLLGGTAAIAPALTLLGRGVLAAAVPVVVAVWEPMPLRPGGAGA